MNERVKLIRKQLGMTQEQLAQRLGIGKAALSMIETGKAGLSARNRNILVQELNVNPDWLETGKGNMFNAEPDLTAYMHRTDNSLPLQSVPLYSIEGTAGLVPLFTDQAHFVLVFCDDGNGRFNAAYWAGAMTGSVLDDEAINIFKAYLSQNYEDMSLSEEEIFSDAFADTADRIMTVTPSPLPIIAVCVAVIIVAVVVFLIVRNRRLAKQREAERMQEILNTPLESLADAELADLEKKYAQAGASDAPPVQPTKPRP